MKKVVSNFEKQNIFEVQKRMYEFVQNFEGGENDEENLVKLDWEVKKLKAGISPEVYSQIDGFIKDVLDPMVYEYDKVFEKVNSHAELKNNALDFVDKENFIKAMGDFFEILLEIESKLDEFVMKELHPYLIG
ncbi:hypothetical protein [uncultured Clostridium sp.]|uniref:hypothetical protein n=1 Tax=uncultured Clostridium sp. TaxID=59620 RepID=UPI00258FE684|nr:hypothetical protein [uncultured Clostridium sp.]